MTRKEFNKQIMHDFNEFKDAKLATDCFQIFEDSYEIAKITSLKDYLTERDDEFVVPLFDLSSKFRVLFCLYDFEISYDTPQWCNWDDIDAMVSDFINDCTFAEADKASSNG